MMMTIVDGRVLQFDWLFVGKISCMQYVIYVSSVQAGNSKPLCQHTRSAQCPLDKNSTTMILVH